MTAPNPSAPRREATDPSSRMWSAAYHEFLHEGVSEDHAMARADVLRIEFDRLVAALPAPAAPDAPLRAAAKFMLDWEAEADFRRHRDVIESASPSAPRETPGTLDSEILEAALIEWFAETGIGAWAHFEDEDIALLVLLYDKVRAARLSGPAASGDTAK